MHQYEYPLSVVFNHAQSALNNLDENSPSYDPQAARRILGMVMGILAFEALKDLKADSFGSEHWNDLIQAVEGKSRGS